MARYKFCIIIIIIIIIIICSEWSLKIKIIHNWVQISIHTNVLVIQQFVVL